MLNISQYPAPGSKLNTKTAVIQFQRTAIGVEIKTAFFVYVKAIAITRGNKALDKKVCSSPYIGFVMVAIYRAAASP